jgi:hypothetical protein
MSFAGLVGLHYAIQRVPGQSKASGRRTMHIHPQYRRSQHDRVD